MPYLGNSHIAGDQINNFKVLDDISSHTSTFDGSASGVVSISDNTIRIPEHRFVQGQRVTYNNGGGGNIGNLSSGTAYYIIKDTNNTIKLATSLSDANSSTAINISVLGSGSSHTLNVAFDGVNTKFKVTHNGGTPGRINNATQLSLAINNVIQRPNQNAATFTEGFAIEDQHKIIFKVAPTSSDIFWGSILANTLPTFDITDNKIDNFTGDGSTTEFNLSNIPASNKSIMVTINGVLQHPSDGSTSRSYTLLSNILQFTAAPGNGDEIQVRHIGFAGASTSDVTGFYGRTGNVVLTSNDHITTGNINAGVVTATTFVGNLTGNVSGNLTVGGVLTYEDVTNVDSIGIITARSGFKVLAGGANVVGVITARTNIHLEDYIHHLGDLTTKIGFPAANTFTVDTAGDERLRITSGGVVGIGTDDPTGAQRLNLYADSNGGGGILQITQDGTGDAAIDFQLKGTREYSLGIDNSDDDKFKLSSTAGVDSNTIFTATSDGKVGINSATPNTRLDVIESSVSRTWTPGSSVVSMFERNSNSRIAIVAGSSSYGEIDFGDANDDNAGYIRYDHSDNSMSFRTNADERLRITSDGKVGIGTDDPNGKTHIHESSAGSVTAATDANELVLESANNVGMSFLTGATSLSRIKFGDTTATNRGILLFNHSDQSFRFQHISDERLRITPTEINAKVPITGAVPAPNRNLIENGEFLISQRFGNASSTKANSGTNIVNGVENGVIDRWRMGSPSASNFSRQRVTDAPDGFAYSYKITADGSGYSPSSNANYSLFQQIIEATNVARLAFGTSSAKTVTLSFYVKSSYASTWAVALGNTTGGVYVGNTTRTHIKSYTTNSANTWERKTITFPGDTSGTWAKTGTGGGLSVIWDLGSGGNHQGAATSTWVSDDDFRFSGAKNVGDSANGSWQITGIQLEIGDTATEYEHVPIQYELQRCQRYFYCSSTLASGSWNSATVFHCAVHHPVAMRARVTTGSTRSGVLTNINIEPRDAYDVTTFSPAAHTHYSPDHAHTNQTMNFTISGSTTTGYSGTVSIDRNDDQFWLSAEL